MIHSDKKINFKYIVWAILCLSCIPNVRTSYSKSSQRVARMTEGTSALPAFCIEKLDRNK